MVTARRRNVVVLGLCLLVSLFLLLVPLVPISTSYPPMAVVRDECGNNSMCFGIGFAGGTASVGYLLSGGNLGLIEYFSSNQGIFVACNPLEGAGAAGGCLVDWLWTNWTFGVSLSYAGPWHVTYYAYPSGTFSGPDNGAGSYTKGSYGGSGPDSRTVTLSGGEHYAPIVCAVAQKLDSSSSNLTLTVNAPPYYGSNTTALPDGSTYACSHLAQPSSPSTLQQGGEIETITVTTTVSYPAGTTTVTECSTASTTAATQSAAAGNQASITVTTTTTTTETDYGATTTVKGC